MPIDTLNIEGEFDLRGFIVSSDRGSVLNVKFGAAGVPPVEVLASYGTGAGQCSWMYYAERTLAATTFDLLDLSGVLTNGVGDTIAATKLKFALIVIQDADGVKKLQVGPQNQAGAMQGPWGGVTAAVYKEVTDWEVVVKELVAGYTVAAGVTDIWPVYNPTASAITYHVLLAGV